MSGFGRFSIYFSIFALFIALAPAANVLSILMDSARSNPQGPSIHPNIYLIWMGQAGFYVVAIGLLIATVRRDGRR